MTRLLTYFLRGLVVVAPVGITLWICYWLFTTIDKLLGAAVKTGPQAVPLNESFPGVGFALTLVLITVIGFLASSLVTAGSVAALEHAFERLPFVRLLYTSTKDLLNAFVGEKRRFDKPVLVSMTPDGAIKLVGFLTAESLSSLGEADHVTVYLPTSYSIAGHVVLVPADRVRRVDADAAHVMAFIVSGGVTQVGRDGGDEGVRE
jgi:uncharacterized membrane protein